MNDNIPYSANNLQIGNNQQANMIPNINQPYLNPQLGNPNVAASLPYNQGYNNVGGYVPPQNYNPNMMNPAMSQPVYNPNYIPNANNMAGYPQQNANMGQFMAQAQNNGRRKKIIICVFIVSLVLLYVLGSMGS